MPVLERNVKISSFTEHRHQRGYLVGPAWASNRSEHSSLLPNFLLILLPLNYSVSRVILTNHAGPGLLHL